MKKLLTVVFSLLLGASMAIAQAGSAAPSNDQASTTKTAKTSKTKKHAHKAGKKSKKAAATSSTAAPSK